MSIYEFSVKARNGSEVPLSKYRGEVLLIVNSSTEDRFVTQYNELERLYRTYNGKGFEVLDFPCDQFGDSTPMSNEDIHRVCESRFGITFPQFSKVDVKGRDASPLFKWLSDNTFFDGFGISPRGILLSREVRKKDRNYLNNNDVKWNFTKFLVDRDGYVVDRFEPTDMKRLEEGIERLL